MTKILLVIIAMLMASPASAAITRIEDFNGVLLNVMYFGEDGHIPDTPDDPVDPYVCKEALGQYATKPTGKDCNTKTFDGGTVCYVDCTCKKDEYPFSATACMTPAFVPSTEKCTDDVNTYYKDCSCGNDYVLAGDSVISESAFDFSGATSVTASHRNGGASVKCYLRSGISCNTSTSDQIPMTEVDSITAEGKINYIVFSKNEPASYYAISPISANTDEIHAGNSVLCVLKNRSAVLDSTKAVYATEPLTAKCASVKSKALKYGKKETYYYYSGDCQTAGVCGYNKGPTSCVSYGTSSFKTYTPDTNTVGNGSCSYVNGCEIMNSQNEVCSESDGYIMDGTAKYGNVISTAIADNVSSTILCARVTGCANGAEVVTQNVSSDDRNLIRDVAKADSTYQTAGTTYAICYGIGKCDEYGEEERRVVAYKSHKDSNGQYAYIICGIPPADSGDDGDDGGDNPELSVACTTLNPPLKYDASTCLCGASGSHIYLAASGTNAAIANNENIITSHLKNPSKSETLGTRLATICEEYGGVMTLTQLKNFNNSGLSPRKGNEVIYTAGGVYAKYDGAEAFISVNMDATFAGQTYVYEGSDKGKDFPVMDTSDTIKVACYTSHTCSVPSTVTCTPYVYFDTNNCSCSSSRTSPQWVYLEQNKANSDLAAIAQKNTIVAGALVGASKSDILGDYLASVCTRAGYSGPMSLEQYKGLASKVYKGVVANTIVYTSDGVYTMYNGAQKDISVNMAITGFGELTYLFEGTGKGSGLPVLDENGMIYVACYREINTTICRVVE